MTKIIRKNSVARTSAIDNIAIIRDGFVRANMADPMYNKVVPSKAKKANKSKLEKRRK